MHVKPILLAIWLAEEVVDDAQTGRLTAHGLFNQIAIAPDAVQYFDCLSRLAWSQVI